MRRSLLVSTVLLAAGLGAGCTSADEKPTVGTVGSKDVESAMMQRSKISAKTKEAAQAVQDYAYAQKAEFVDRMKKELAEIQGELDRLAAKVDRSSGAAKADAKGRLEAVRERWAQAKRQLERAEGATESTWDDVKGGFKKSYGELQDSFEKTREWLSEEIAP